jgi:hypothetical protein
MSLDNIQLPAIVIADLFKNCLVDLNISEAPAIAATSKKQGFSFLGNNKKKIVIVVADAEAIYLAEDALNFLLGILTACKLNMEDVALVNTTTNPTLTYKDVQEQLQAENILLFGVTPAQLQLPLAFPQYQIQKYNGQMYLAAPALQLLAQDKGEKTKLWNCLKQLFSIA